MNIARDQLRKLRWPALVFVMLAAAGAASVVLSMSERERAGRALTAAKQQQNQTEERLRQVRSEELEIRDKTATFQKLVDRGIVGPENRLDWVELLRSIRDREQLFEMNYEIFPQQKVETAVHGYDFLSSRMRLDLNLLHEEDLLRLLTAVQRDANALVLPRECAVTRTARSVASERGGPPALLAAQCSLEWMTLRSPEKKS